MKNHKLEKLAKEWFQKGSEDLDLAKFVFQETEHFSRVCLLTQQTAEKYLKGYLAYHNVNPPKIHSLAALRKSCETHNKQLRDIINECKILDEYYIPARYPVSTPVNYDAAKAKEAIELAEQIIELIGKDIDN